MKNFAFGLAVFLLVVVFGGLYSFLPKGSQPVLLKEARIGGEVFMLEIADTPAKRAKGLSGQPNLSENQGLLFVFEIPDKYGFWMKGMRFPLDILWIAGNKVVGIEKNIPADSAASYYPPEPVDKVLEINAGLADKLGIKTGDSVLLE